MKRLRTHMARIIVVVLVWTGFGLYVAQPIHASRSQQAFANWLSKMANTSDGVALQQELDNLQESVGHLDRMIQEASKIVSSNNNHFDFSFAESVASQQLYQLLLIEWSQFQTGNAMASVPTQPTVKLLVSVVIDKIGPAGFSTVAPKSTSDSFLDGGFSLSIEQIFATALVPMAGGIAIGAP